MIATPDYGSQGRCFRPRVNLRTLRLSIDGNDFLGVQGLRVSAIRLHLRASAAKSIVAQWNPAWRHPGRCHRVARKRQVPGAGHGLNVRRTCR